MRVVANQRQTFKCQTGQAPRDGQTLRNASDQSAEQNFRNDWHLTRDFAQFIQRIDARHRHLKCFLQLYRNIHQTLIVGKCVDDGHPVASINSIAIDVEIFLEVFLWQWQRSHDFQLAVVRVFFIEIVFPTNATLAFVHFHCCLSPNARN